MNKFLSVIFLLALTNVVVAKGISLSDVFGERPKYWVEIGGGYEVAPEATSKITPKSQKLWEQSTSKYLKMYNTNASGFKGILIINTTTKLWFGVDYTFASAKQSMDWTDPVNHGHFGELIFHTSPTISLNYAPISIYGVRPYLGIGVNKVSISGKYTVPSGKVFETSGGGTNVLFRAGVTFPIWKRLSGVLAYQGNQGVNIRTLATTNGDITNTNLGQHFFSGGVNIALF